MQWRKLARSKITSGRSRTRNMLCCGRRKDNGREALDLTASPLRAAPGPTARNNHPPPMVIQGDFRKVSGISTEIFKQIEQVENDHDATTAAALEHVERRGEMIVRILDARQLGRSCAEAAKRFQSMQDAKHTVQFVEIVKRPGQTLGLYIREGNGIDRTDGVFISRIALESAVYNSGCLKVGDEILAVNLVDVTRMSLDDVVIIMSIPRRLVLATRQRKGGIKGGQESPNVQPRNEHKPPPVVVIKRDLREDEIDEPDLGQHSRDTMRQRHTGDGREMSESRSRLGLGGLDGRGGHTQDTNGLDLYYNSRPPDSWGYQPPPPVITEQPKGNIQHFQPFERGYPGTLESLAEKVHSFGLPNHRRMSAGNQPIPGRLSGQSQQSPSSHYYVQHTGTGSRRIMPRSGSDQHLPHTEYADYTSITPAGRHSLLRSSLKSGSTLSRYNQRYVDQTSVAAQLAQAKYASSGQYAGAGTLTRRNRSSLDYSSDTEATCGPRNSYYYYRQQAPPVQHSTLATLGRSALTSGGPSDISSKFNSLPRDTRGATRLAMNKRFGPASALLQDEADGNLSAPEMPSLRQRDEYRQWLSRTPSTSAIYEQIRASRDVLNQQRAARFTYSAENIHAALKDTEGGYYSAYGRPGVTATLDRNFSRAQHQTPARSLSTQHITSSPSVCLSALASSRSPSMRRMRQLLELDAVRAGAPSPVPTPSGTLPRGQRQLDINPAEFLKYKIDKPMQGSGLSGLPSLGGSGLGGEEPISGLLWVHLLAGRGLRASTGSSNATTPVTPSGGTAPTIGGSTGMRDLYCVLECDRVHKARTVVRTGDLVFDWDESFELDLVYNRELDLLIYSWDPQYRHKLCYKGSVHLASLLKSGPLHQLALKIEPRGTLYLRLRHTDSFTLYRRRGISSMTLSRTQPLFGVDLESIVNREAKTGGIPGGVSTGLAGPGQQVPIIIRRCVEEIERRGLDIIGLYRLCGSATKKRILREAFERNSRSVDLTPDNVPDINVITGVLKDYLRELPEPLFTKCLYQMMVDALGVCLPDDPEGNAKLMFSILDCLPRANRSTLIFLMDHLALVVSASDRNKMSAQNLATALAPVLILHSNADGHPTAVKHEVDYNQPIGVLKYLLQIWPTPKHHSGRRARLPGPRGDSRSALAPAAAALGAASGAAGSAVNLAQRPLASEPSRHSVAPFPPPPRSLVSGPRGPAPPVPSHQTLGQSSVNKGPYRPLSPRVGPVAAPPPGCLAASAGAALASSAAPSQPAHKPRQVIVSSPGSPSSSSDSQSGSDSVKHYQTPSSRAVSASPAALRGSPSSMRNSPTLRHTPSSGATTTSNGTSAFASTKSPSITSLSRASPSFGTTRSSSPAMQGSSAGMAVTLASATSALSTLTGLQSTISNINTTAGNLYSLSYSQPSQPAPPPSQPTTFASTNPFLTGAYLNYTTSESSTYGGNGSSKPYSNLFDTSKYSYDTSPVTNGKGYDRSYENGKDSTNATSKLFDKLFDNGKYGSGSSSSAYDSHGNHGSTTNNHGGHGNHTNNGKDKPFAYETFKSYSSAASDAFSTSDVYTTSMAASDKYKSYLATTTSGYNPYKYDSSSPRDVSPSSTGNGGHVGNGHDGNGSNGGGRGGHLQVEETPTPTSSIETEDSNTREVGEKDVEGDGELSD
ncbi:rho GTPase-activating protein 100F isoform X3 [Atheta coriaria]|uniref:rho GTPase-activating protein 100F isoform X3 n=1 Tax=Dalotia coriaria TaxID=877792 RepID=UPI0031F43408